MYIGKEALIQDLLEISNGIRHKNGACENGAYANSGNSHMTVFFNIFSYFFFIFIDNRLVCVFSFL